MKLIIDHYKTSEFNKITNSEKEIIETFFKKYDKSFDLEDLLHSNSDYEHVKTISDNRKNIISFYPIEKDKTVLEVLNECGIDKAQVRVVDRGALECVIKARVETAVMRGKEEA